MTQILGTTEGGVPHARLNGRVGMECQPSYLDYDIWARVGRGGEARRQDKRN